MGIYTIESQYNHNIHRVYIGSCLQCKQSRGRLILESDFVSITVRTIVITVWSVMEKSERLQRIDSISTGRQYTHRALLFSSSVSSIPSGVGRTGHCPSWQDT